MPTDEQRETCEANGVEPDDPKPSDRVGIALQTLDREPLNGLRVRSEAGTCGWYIWAGEWSDASDFFKPLCVEHLSARCPSAVPFLSLPAGWRFLTDGEHTDVWYDDDLLRA